MKKLALIFFSIAALLTFALPAQAIVCRTAICAKNVRAAALAALANPPAPKPVVAPVVIVRPEPVYTPCNPLDISLISGGATAQCE